VTTDCRLGVCGRRQLVAGSHDGDNELCDSATVAPVGGQPPPAGTKPLAGGATELCWTAEL